MMEKSSIFKPTPQFKELLILTLILNNKSITQREIAKATDLSVATINEYLERLENNGYIERKYHTKKIVEYLITKEGKNRIKVLNINYMESSMDVFREAKKELNLFLENVQSKYHNIILYGAGEVASTILFVIDSTPTLNLNVLSVIDDDINKIGKKIVGRNIVSYNDAVKMNHDCIFISTYANEKVIYEKLKKYNYDLNKVVEFFD